MPDGSPPSGSPRILFASGIQRDRDQSRELHRSASRLAVARNPSGTNASHIVPIVPDAIRSGILRMNRSARRDRPLGLLWGRR